MTASLPHPLRARAEHHSAAGPAPGLERRRWEVRGTVQGVGFRPFVHQLASELDLAGHVRNTGGTVLIDADGTCAALNAFEARLRAEAPPLAVLTGLTQLPPRPGAAFAGFVIEESLASTVTDPTHRDVPPDAGICDACLAELLDPANRRYRYPFINCVDCGPRATIVSALPYDRRRTSMAGFELCPDCATEYRDPTDRRFHAEPIACPVCGPQLSWRDGMVEVCGETALAAAAACVVSGGIIALKGLGGYQFVCDATDPATVALLRKRKHRPAKPLAVMVADLRTAAHYAHLSAEEQRLMTGPARPIVLADPRTPQHTAPIKNAAPIAAAVRADSPSLGIFLPTTGLHHLLIRAVGRPLVVTSGNLGGAPIVTDDEQAWEDLRAVADGVCAHNRPILARYDDSVVSVVGEHATVVRRARGYAPAPQPLPVRAPAPLLAVGAQLKHTFTLARSTTAITSTHTGDLENAATLDAFTDGLARLKRLHAIEPEYVAHDLHPGYMSTHFAQSFPQRRRIAVQHHHAHIASCAAEHSLTGDVIGVAYDGLGLGDDGTLWGGELMVANLSGYTRLGRFARAPLPGGAAAITHPPRMALGYLAGLEALSGREIERAAVDRFVRRLDPAMVATVLRMISQGVNAPAASSAGRLFDAAAALLGLSDTVSYEGEAAIALENAAGDVRVPALPWRLVRVDGLWVYDPRPTLVALLDGDGPAASVADLAAGFHETITEVTVALVEKAARVVGEKPVCLSGGVWQNRRLARSVLAALSGQGFDVFVNQRMPCNDGGISYGQAAVAAATLAGR